MNMPAHGLTPVELVVVLHEMFENHLLVAKKEGRNFFTPTLAEIEAALHETNDLNYRSSNTFYGLTNAALDLLTDLRAIYNEEKAGKRHCSFCARALDDAKLLVEGSDNARICDLCIEGLHRRIAISPPDT